MAPSASNAPQHGHQLHRFVQRKHLAFVAFGVLISLISGVIWITKIRLVQNVVVSYKDQLVESAAEARQNHVTSSPEKSPEPGKVSVHSLADFEANIVTPVQDGEPLLNECFAQANARHIRDHSTERKKAYVPIFTSIVKTPDASKASQTTYWTAHFTLCHVTWMFPRKKQKRIPHWTEGDWSCDGQPARVAANGCPKGTGLSIICPQHGDNDTIHNITVYNLTYYVHDHVKCEKQHPLRAPSKDAKVAAAVLMYRMKVDRMLEWMEYHRLIVGIDHFFLYTMDETLDDHQWPNLPYVTYVPWNLNAWMLSNWDRFLHQNAAQVDAILRGRALGLEWVAFNDMDEFLVRRSPPNASLGQSVGQNSMKIMLYLDGFPDVAAVQIETTTFGASPEESKAVYDMALNYTWRSEATYGKIRCKCIVRPRRVNYYNIHWVTSGRPIHKADPQNEVWLQHYKNPHDGVFLKDLENKNIVRDAFLRDQYHDMIHARVKDVLRTTNEAIRDGSGP